MQLAGVGRAFALCFLQTNNASLLCLPLLVRRVRAAACVAFCSGCACMLFRGMGWPAAQLLAWALVAFGSVLPWPSAACIRAFFGRRGLALLVGACGCWPAGGLLAGWCCLPAPVGCFWRFPPVPLWLEVFPRLSWVGAAGLVAAWCWLAAWWLPVLGLAVGRAHVALFVPGWLRVVAELLLCARLAVGVPCPRCPVLAVSAAN